MALIAPAGTVTLNGTVAADGLSLDSATTAPPAGAGPLNVAVPCEGSLPRTLGGLSVIADSAMAGGAAAPMLNDRSLPDELFWKRMSRAITRKRTSAMAALGGSCQL